MHEQRFPEVSRTLTRPPAPAGVHEDDAGLRPASNVRIRWSLTGPSVPSCWAHSETRYSSSIQRARRSALARRPTLGQRGEPGGGTASSTLGDLVHQLPVAERRRPSSRSRRRRIARRYVGKRRSRSAPASPEEAAGAPAGPAARACPAARAASPAPRGRSASGRCRASRTGSAAPRPAPARCARRARRAPAATSAAYSSGVRTGGRASTTSARIAARRSSRSSATEGYGEPARPSRCGGVEAGGRVAADGQREQQEPAYAEPVARLGLLARSRRPRARRSRPRR